MVSVKLMSENKYMLYDNIIREEINIGISLTEFYEIGTKSIERIIADYLKSKSMNFSELVWNLKNQFMSFFVLSFRKRLKTLTRHIVKMRLARKNIILRERIGIQYLLLVVSLNLRELIFELKMILPMYILRTKQWVLNRRFSK